MANAADYLLFNTTQLLTTYKLRTRSIEAKTVTATNISPNYILSTNLLSTFDGITLTPSSFILQPNETIAITVEYNTEDLETFPAGTLEGSITATVSARPIIIPEIPTVPPAPPLPEAPRQIISRIQITPTSFTLSEINETIQFSAILYVDNVATPATFNWSIENDQAEAFMLDSATGIVKAMKNGINKATIKARLVTPTQYVGTEGISLVASNVPIIQPIGAVDPVVTTGNLTVIIDGTPNSIGANVTISGLNQSITKTTTFNNIPAGTYTITPIVVSSGGINYNPSGGGEIYVTAGQNAQVTVKYTKQAPPDVNSIQITELYTANGTRLQNGSTINVGDKITILANTYRNGNIANIGDVRFNVNNTQEGVQVIQSRIDGQYKAIFTVTEPGVINISAINDAAGSATGQINATTQSVYKIRISAPPSILVGQCTPITVVVLKDGIETNIPVDVNLAGTLQVRGQPTAILNTQPCGPVSITEPPPPIVNVGGGGGSANRIILRTAGGQEIIGGPSVDGTETIRAGGGGIITDQVAFIDSGINAI